MNKFDALRQLEDILSEAKSAVLATTDKDGIPRLRWMNPVFLKDKAGTFYCLTSPGFKKLIQINNKPQIEWLFQTPSLAVVANVRGVINIIENSALRSEVLEKLSPYLSMFWKINTDERDLIVLETIIERITVLYPIKGKRETVEF